jgi:hypothetical protein
MSLLSRKKTLLAKIESVYGTDPTPTGSANAMLVKNLNVSPLQAELVSRDLIRPYLGNSENLLANKFVQLDFEVEMVGAGVVGKIPAYDVLLKACGFARAATTGAIASITRVSTTATATRNAHGYEVGDKVTISGAVESAYNGEVTIIAKATNTFDYTVSGSPTSPATGSPVVTTKQTYAPVSGSFDSATLYFNIDGVLHKITGARGNVELGITVKQIPFFKFSFIGIYNAVVDDAAPTVDYAGFQIPKVANTQATPSYSLLGFSGSGVESINLNVTNDVQYITLIGSESVKIIDRKPAGTIVLEAPTIAAKDFFSAVEDQDTGLLEVTQDNRNGYKVKLSLPAVLLGNPSYTDNNGIQMLSLPFTANPSSAGNDEIALELT